VKDREGRGEREKGRWMRETEEETEDGGEQRGEKKERKN
jgi:hypothetical protein